MWGSSFTDLAKAAQNIQEQAAAAADAASSSLATPSLFNLDAMQQEETAAKKSSRPPPSKVESKETPVTPIVKNSLPLNRLTPVKQMSPPRSTGGKLKVPSSAKEVSVPLTETEAKPKMAPAQEDGDKEGWAEDDDDLDFEDDEVNDEAQNTKSEQSLPDKDTGESAVNDETAGLDEHGLSSDDIPSQLNDPGDENEADQISPDESIKKVQTDTNSSTSLPSPGSSDSDPVAVDPSKASSIENHLDVVDNDSQSAAISLPKEKPEDPAESPSPIEKIQPDEEVKTITSSPSDSGSTSKQPKVLILCSMNSMNKKAHKRQERAFTILKGQKIAFESIDGADPQHKNWRDELFELCGQKGEYPQIFLLSVEDGSTSYWGPSDRLEHANDSGTLHDELTGKHVTQWSPVSTSVQAPSKPVPKESPKQVSDEILEKFALQMQRVEENHVAEMAALKESHKRALEEAVMSVTNNSLAEQESLKASYETKLYSRDEEFHELLRTNEGMKLKLDVLQREVTGTQQLLEARDSDLGEANQSFADSSKALEKKLAQSEQRNLESQRQVEKIKQSLETKGAELETTLKELSDLKSRVKVVAGELKERRNECRQFHATVEEMESNKASLESVIEDLQSRVSQQNRSGSDQMEQMSQLREQLSSATAAIEAAEEHASTVKAEGDKALEDYKRKAQHSLSMANSRTASAIQAKEEAELEARAARSTADTSMDRAVKAELVSKEALAEAKAFVAAAETARDRAVEESKKVRKQLVSLEEEVARIGKDLTEAVGARESSEEKLRVSESILAREMERTKQFEENASHLQKKVTELKDQSTILREELNRAEREVASGSTPSEGNGHPNTISELNDQGGDEEAIRMLQDELRFANAAIEDLKEALKNAVESGSAEPSVAPTEHSSDDSEPSNIANDATPLFFAMEKQLELKTARNEINRLANLLADVQSEKTEAVEAMIEMRKKAADAESRLKRYEKLRPARNVEGDGRDESEGDSGSTNIEYLKNIMVRFLNAKTLSEKKSLVSVIGAVLCLTPEEQQVAMKNLDEASSLGGVGQSFFESFVTK